MVQPVPLCDLFHPWDQQYIHGLLTALLLLLLPAEQQHALSIWLAAVVCQSDLLTLLFVECARSLYTSGLI